MKIVIAILLAGSVNAYATNYVVIGAFSNRNNAESLSQKANGSFDINPVRHLYYVFVLTTEDHGKAINEARRLQQETAFKDAWVFVGALGENGSGVDVSPITEKQITVEQPVIEQPAVREEPPVVKAPPPPVPENKADDPKANAKDFYFKVVNDNGAEISGAEITALNPANQRKEYAFTGNQNVTMKAIANSDDIRFECDLAGYRKIVTTLNFKDPLTTDGIKIENNRIIVPFHLVRLKKGDVAILYNVFFYKDAAIMRPESKFDLDGVLTMMNENPTYKIMIHGHTNGSASGPILEAGESGNYFSLTGAKEGNGSAKKLSQKRADAIREYLISQGVDPNRMFTKAWGGKKPVYDKHSATAHANVRVEVEVIDE